MSGGLNVEALTQQLLSLRAGIDAALAILAPSPAGPGCHHAGAQNVTGMGEPGTRWACPDCGEEWRDGPPKD